MKKLVILGNSISGVKASKEIRKNDSSCEITIVALDGHYPYNSELFAKLITKEITEEQLFYRPKEFYESQRISVITDKKINRINLKKNIIFTEEKVQIAYDTLLITDLPAHKLPSIKGANKEGVFGLRRLNDLKEALERLGLTETIAIKSESLSGLHMAMAFAKGAQEVLLVMSTQDELIGQLDEDAKQRVMASLEEKKLRIISDSRIEEVLGNGDVKAIKLKSGKVLASEMVLFSDTVEDYRFLAESLLRINRKICVDEQFRTNLANVFAVAPVCELQTDARASDDLLSLEELERQGEAVGRIMSQKSPSLEGTATEESAQVGS